MDLHGRLGPVRGVAPEPDTAPRPSYPLTRTRARKPISEAFGLTVTHNCGYVRRVLVMAIQHRSVPRLDCYRWQVRRSAGDGIRRRNRRTWIAFLGGIGLLGAALLASMTRAIPDLITTVASLMGVAGMIYGVATGTLMVFDRKPDDK